ncbi:MAG: HAD-superfamily hydrolase, subfamily IA, variant 3 [Acetothermia bacterium 64_32]|nr:MAG: HAD-superfamily hydrolase, subfamily IA, variant 3 [Acetothermia bacterium 64_32]HAF71223.1 hypothetical protein [Candidatus Acetothermia bacterium]
MGTVKALALDGHGVVYSRNREVPEAVVGALQGMGKLKVPPEEALRQYLSLQERAFSGELSYREMLARLAKAVGWEGVEAVEGIHRLIQRFSADIVVDPDLVSVLSRLRAGGVKIAMLTNSIHPAETKWDWLRRRGVDALFDLIYSSVEAGHKKPAPEIFSAFARSIGLSPGEVVFVGHDQAEVQGAKRAGLISVCLRCRCAEADFVCDRLGEILRLPVWPPGV